MLARTLLACATFVVATIAQSTSTIIAFTNPPANITAGKNVVLTWAGGDGSPVTLTLQQGLPSDLQTVQLITGSATGTSYTWPVPSSLPDASNYAFKIQQGDNPPNYTGMITLTGGATTGPTLAVSALASSSSSTSTSASVSATSTVGTSPASGGVVGGGSSNGTSSSGNATTTAAGAVGTGAGASGSAATGTALSRNTTMSHATLTSSSTSSSSSSAAATSSSSSTGTSTSSSPSPSSSKTSAAITLATSNFALLCAAVVGIAYLG